MRMVKRRIPKGSQEYDATILMEGKQGEYEMDVLVIYSESAPEPDVGWSGGIEIEGVYFEDAGCQMGDMTDDQLDALALEIGEYNHSAWEAAAEAYHERD